MHSGPDVNSRSGARLPPLPKTTFSRMRHETGADGGNSVMKGPLHAAAVLILMAAGTIAAAQHEDTRDGTGLQQPAATPAMRLARLAAEVQFAEDVAAIRRLQRIYGYYLDKGMWDDVVALLADDAVAHYPAGTYVAQDSIRRHLLLNVGGGEMGENGLRPGRPYNHLSLQSVIHLAPDGDQATIRSRMLQQLNVGTSASTGAAVYENEAVREDGAWKFRSVHAYNTWGASYEEGWARTRGRAVPGISDSYPPDRPPTTVFTMFPAAYELPWHYANPVSGRHAGPAPVRHSAPGNTVTRSPPSQDDTMLAGTIPLHIATELREIGARIEAQRTGELYAPLHRIAPFSGVDLARDIPYGDHERHVLDVFSPQARDSAKPVVAKPVVVFVHGGGFSGGAKSTEGSPFYDNVPLWAAENGLVGVNINYRLAPEFVWPAGIEDVAAVVAWVREHIDAYGGDPRRVFLWGHSAGAAHVADYIAWRTRRDEGPGIAGAILLSGFYDLGTEESQWAAYYGDDVSTYAERSSLAALARSPIPLMIVDAQLDPEYFQLEADKLARARAAMRRPVRRLHLVGHSHLSEGFAVGTGDHALTGPLLDFVMRSESVDVALRSDR